MRLLAGVIVAASCATLPWLAWRANRTVLAAVAALPLAVIVVGAVVGLGLYPVSDVVVLAFAVAGGILLGRALPPRFCPFFVFLVALSVLDLIQVWLTSGPSPVPSTPSTGVNSHLIWLNFRIGLPGGHFNIGFLDLLLITAMSEHFRRRDRPVAIALLPGVLGVALAQLVAGVVGGNSSSGLASLTQALIPYLTVGWLLASALAVDPFAANRSGRDLHLGEVSSSPGDERRGNAEDQEQQSD